MKNAIPTLGYPTRTAACVALEAEGLTSAQIGARVGIPATTVAALLCSARRFSDARSAPDACKSVHFPIRLLQQLQPAARKRRVSRETLAWMIVERVAEDDLIDAVLDDGGEQ